LAAPNARRIARPLVKVMIKVAFAASLGALAAATLQGVAPAVAAGSLVYVVTAALLFGRKLLHLRDRIVQRGAHVG
jgi:hypothetical protein